MLDDFEQAGAIFPLRQSIEHRGIDEYTQRLVKTADEILACHQVHGRLAADGRIYLAEQSGGNLHQWNPSHEDSREKSRDIGYDAAADRDDDAGTVGAALHHLLGERFDLRQPFPGFASWEEQNAMRKAIHSAQQSAAVQVPNIGRRDEKHLAAAIGNMFAHRAERASLDDHGIAPK